MPGILPMKVIKVGTSAQTRIAQACDRCRSKKIRCDGFRPTCTQCSNVGFECKTSDKLSRRAFPRGYTESLEERVRALETEVRDLKDLLDEKDESIDMLSKMHSNSPSGRRPSSALSTADTSHAKDCIKMHKDQTFKIQQSPYLVHGENTDSYFAGNSSSRAFLLSFKRKLQESGTVSIIVDIDTFLSSPLKIESPAPLPTSEPMLWTPPSRLHSDQMVNIYFQEWAPIFPVLHRPAFLALYEQYVSNSNAIQDKKSLAQLNLVFGIATLSNQTRLAVSVESCERQWVAALESFIKETSLATLQCLVLAQIYCIQKGELEKVFHYKGLAVAMSQRLGLHLSQKRFSLGVLTVETRKKVFWSLYVVDCFSAALLGLPRMLREEDIFCEYPVDADDENVTEKGFQPSVPGEYTKISSALALFRGSRIMAKVLEQNYSSAACHESSLQDVAALDQELEEWSDSLPAHLKLHFVQDKPSAHVTSSRSPLLSLTYNFIRTLIHRPAVCADLGDRASSSAVTLAASYKQIIQIIQLLEERSLSFSHCLNKDEMLMMSGIGLLMHSLDLDKEGKLMKDCQRLVTSVTRMLEVRNAPGSAPFKQLGCSMLSLPTSIRPTPSTTDLCPKKSSSPDEVHQTDATGGHQQLASLAARYSLAASTPKHKCVKDIHKSMPAMPLPPVEYPQRRSSEKPLRPLMPLMSSRAASVCQLSSNQEDNTTKPSPRKIKASRSPASRVPGVNLDYFSFLESKITPRSAEIKTDHDDANVWDKLIDTFHTPSHNSSSSDSIYEWPQLQTMLSPAQMAAQSGHREDGFDQSWVDDVWTYEGDVQGSVPPQSVLSLSEESLTNSEDFSSVDYGSSRADSVYQTITIPHSMADNFSAESLVDLDGFHQHERVSDWQTEYL